MPTPSASDLSEAQVIPGQTGIQTKVDPALVARFRDDVTALAVAPSVTAPLALAVSGGADSMAMLALAHAAFPDAIAAATIDHRLRPDNIREAQGVARWCAGVGIAHRTMAVDAAPAAGENLQAWARAARYLLLVDWTLEIGGAALATAHHADDLAETFLMRAARGAGLSGLAGVRARRDEMIVTAVVRESDGTIVIESPMATIRPLLAWRRDELRDLACAASLPFCDDPSNFDPRFDRTRVRGWLAGPDAPDPLQLARSARQLAEIDAELRAFALELWDSRALPADGYAKRIDMTGLPRTVRRYLAGMALDLVARLTGAEPVTRNIEPLLDALTAGASATQGDVLAIAKEEVWTFRPAPPRRPSKSDA